jgi:YVTN family beta-propeller protein
MKVPGLIQEFRFDNSVTLCIVLMPRVFVALFALSLISLPVTHASEPLSQDTRMKLVKTLSGNLSPKSVLSSGSGLVSAHNMMYNHTVTIFDANTLELLSTVKDSVDLKALGNKKYSGIYRGAPVEGAFSPDGKYLYFTNYSMYGKGFTKEGHDTCSPASGYDTSFLSRIDLSTYEIDAVYPVGSVPKVVQVTPDNKYILVSNWCSYTLSVISVAEQKVVQNIKIGRYPRGIVVTKDSSFAYVAEMGGNRLHRINLANFEHTYIPIGSNPRALVLSPDNKILYATLNVSGQIAAWDLVADKSLGKAKVGNAARSLDISSDGTALFVTSFKSGTISKVRSSDLKVLQTIKACSEPIGISYDAPTARTWVACYKGSVKVFANE